MTGALHNTKVLESLSEETWMIRPCEVYLDEFKECKGYRGRFHQYYVHGQYKECSQWKKDFDRCVEFRKSNSPQAAEAIIESEQIRRQKRLTDAKENNIWEYRKTPPEDWDKPLPEHLERAKIPKLDEKRLCVIS